MKKILLLILCMAPILLYTQESEDDFFSDDFSFDEMDMDDLFGEEGDDSFLEVVEDQSDEIAEPSSELLTTEGVELGGSFSSSIGAGVSYSDFPDADSLFDDYTESFTPSLSAQLYFNARPTEDTRFYGKVSTSIPFYQSANVLLANEDYDPDAAANYDSATVTPFSASTSHQEGIAANVSIPDITIEELFSDFNWDNKLFFRVGKQNAKWGVGYFFSPADFLSLESIDPENPTADREGPIAIKASVPFGLNNFYTYITVPNSLLESSEGSVSDLIIAPMVQVLLGDVELSSGIYYQKDTSPRIMLSGTYGTNTDFGQLSFFGEAVASYGSDKTFIEEDYTTKTVDDEFFFHATAGFLWSKEIAENNFSVAAQYLYNGEGYDEAGAERVNNVSYFMMQMLGMGDQFSGTVPTTSDLMAMAGGDFSGLGFSDLMNRNRHYMGANFSISNLFDNENLSISAFTMMNLVDISGFVKPTISYSFFDGLSTSLGCTFDLSDDGDEYDMDDFAISLSFTLGGGNF